MATKIMRNRLRLNVRCTASAASSSSNYPFSKAVTVIPSRPTPSEELRKGKGLMEYIRKTIPSPEKQKLIETLFARRGEQRLLPGSIVTVELNHAPGTFSGVLIGIRRRGPDTSFLLRNIVQRTGVEMQFFVNSPHVKEIRAEGKAGGAKPQDTKKQKRAKLFFLRKSPEKMTEVAARKKKRRTRG